MTITLSPRNTYTISLACGEVPVIPLGPRDRLLLSWALLSATNLKKELIKISTPQTLK